jgi:hypothetical protein
MTAYQIAQESDFADVTAVLARHGGWFSGAP